MTVPANLISSNGDEFPEDFLQDISAELSRLNDAERAKYRNRNSNAIVVHESSHLLILAGPGTGKSYLFRDRIKHWLPLSEDDQIYVSSFVRKLVADLRLEIAQDEGILDDDRNRIEVSTLHRLGRSLLERSHGTSSHPLRQHIQILTDYWGEIVWADVLQFHDVGDANWKVLVHQLHEDHLDTNHPWPELWTTYLTLSRFYNSVGFADLIRFAAEAVEEDADLVEHLLWIIDEFQDFNRAEDRLIRAVTNNASAVLMAGDDDQALYVDLKASTPDVILGYYTDTRFANAMLPFCSRCSYHVCMAAAHFIDKHRAATSAAKIYLPLKVEEPAAKVRIVATYVPSTAVGYIKHFLDDHEGELAQHIEEMKEGKETDPFLLVLSPDNRARFYDSTRTPAGQRLREYISAWSVISQGRSVDYHKVLTYCSASWDGFRNLEVRKVLHYEGHGADELHTYIEQAIANDLPLIDIVRDVYPELVEIIDAVSSIVVEDSTSWTEKVEELGRQIEISNPDELASELDQFPISPFADLIEAEAEEAIETAGEMAAIEFMSVVRSKGLSAKHVIMIGCDDVNMSPDRVSALSFFVGITRARDTLHLITSMQARGHAASPYLLDLPEDHCEYLLFTASGEKMLDTSREFVNEVGRWDSAIQRSAEQSRRSRRSQS